MLQLLAQNTNDAGSAAGAIIGVVLSLAWVLILLVGFWRVFTKLGLPGWMGLVPFLNIYMLYKARGQHAPLLWLILNLIPCVNIIALWVLASDTAELFGKGILWKVLLFFFPGFAHLVLGYGYSQADRSALAPGVGLNG
jgi:hypothetical protein